MSITSKIIITDTNIITDLDQAGVLDQFIMFDNVYISDMVLNDEINAKTGNIEIIKKMKVVPSTCYRAYGSAGLAFSDKRVITI